MTHSSGQPLAWTPVLAAVALALSLVPAAAGLAQQEHVAAPIPATPEQPAPSVDGATLATQARAPLVQSSPVPATRTMPALQQQAVLPATEAAGICPVIGDFLQDYCTQYPADAACKVP